MRAIIGLLIMGLIYSCNERKKISKESILREIARYEQILLSDTTGEINLTASYEAIKFYSLYQNQFQQDSLTPEFMFRQACLFKSLGKVNEAISVLKKIEKNYPNYLHMDVCLFMLADIYENMLQDTAKARKYYQDVISKFPKSTLSGDASVLLQNLGKRTEELFQEILKKDTINNVL